MSSSTSSSPKNSNTPVIDLIDENDTLSDNEQSSSISTTICKLEKVDVKSEVPKSPSPITGFFDVESDSALNPFLPFFGPLSPLERIKNLYKIGRHRDLTDEEAQSILDERNHQLQQQQQQQQEPPPPSSSPVQPPVPAQLTSAEVMEIMKPYRKAAERRNNIRRGRIQASRMRAEVTSEIAKNPLLHLDVQKYMEKAGELKELEFDIKSKSNVNVVKVLKNIVKNLSRKDLKKPAEERKDGN